MTSSTLCRDGPFDKRSGITRRLGVGSPASRLEVQERVGDQRDQDQVRPRQLEAKESRGRPSQWRDEGRLIQWGKPGGASMQMARSASGGNGIAAVPPPSCAIARV